MSQFSAPYYRTERYSPPPPPPMNRGRSFTFPLNKNIPTNHHKDVKIPNSINQVKRQYSHQLRIGSHSSDMKSPLQSRTRNYSTCSENGNEKWKKLKSMIEQVNNMKVIVDQIFPPVEIQTNKESMRNYSGCTEYEYQVELLRDVIDEQISRMKAYWCGEESGRRDNSTSSEDQYQIEQIRNNIKEMFTRMKAVVEELLPSDTQQKLTTSWVEDLTSQLTNLEVSIRGFVKSRSCEYISSQTSSPSNELVPDSFAALRIKELETELEASLKREEELTLKLKLVEERNENEIEKMEAQRVELYQMLDRANMRAKKSSDEAYNLKYKMTEIEMDANQKQIELGISERKRAEMEAELTLRRGDQMKSAVGYMRSSPEYVNKHTVDVEGQYRNMELKRSPAPRTENIYDQPKLIPPVRTIRRLTSLRDRSTSVTSQGSRNVSPKERKQVNWNSSMQESECHYFGNEYSKLAMRNNTQLRQYAIESI